MVFALPKLWTTLNILGLDGTRASAITVKFVTTSFVARDVQEFISNQAVIKCKQQIESIV